jgi:hypothetical protein
MTIIARGIEEQILRLRPESTQDYAQDDTHFLLKVNAC